jgi:hypothetical protein
LCFQVSPILTIVDSRIIVRDESLLECDIGKSGVEEMKMLEKMLAEQPHPPMTLLDMYAERLNNVVVSTYPDPPFERSSHRPCSLLTFSNLSPITKILLPSLLPWCRQCDRHGHIDYTTIPCGRCAGSHQTSACPITIMGMCVYCTALGMHFSQLCSQRKYIPYCSKCGKTGHTEDHCSVTPSFA